MVNNYALRKKLIFTQVYTEHTDNIGHTIGPETEDMKLAVRELDGIVLYLLNKLEEYDLQDEGE